MLEHILKSLSLVQPEIALGITFVAAIFVEFIFKAKRHVTGYFVLLGFAVTFILLVMQKSEPQLLFNAMYAVDPFAHFFKYFVLAVSAVIVFFSFRSKELEKEEAHYGEYYSLISATALGMFFMASASHLLMMYISIELVSISSYILAGYMKGTRRSSEASLKYVLFGGISSGLMLYGISLIYGLTGALDIYSIRNYLADGSLSVGTWSFGALIGAIILLLAGFGYKISAVPFHFWTPDVYEGAPITITAYLAVASKAAGFAMMIRFFFSAFFDAESVEGHFKALQGIDWNSIVAVISLLTMTIGNLIAVWQNNLKRLLAYSSIAHAGYMLMGVVVLSNIGLTAILTYFLVYAFMNLGAFYIVMTIADTTGSEDINDYKGLAQRTPFIAAVFSLFLISLTGLPPTAGFIGKFYLFAAVLDSPKFLWLAIAAIINSVISLYYYARIFRNMYLREAEEGSTSVLPLKPVVLIWCLIFAIPTLLFGLYFQPIVGFAQNSIRMFMP